MKSPKLASLMAGVAAGTVALVVGAPIWGGILTGVGVAYVAKKAIG